MFRTFVWTTYRANMLAILRKRELNRVAGQLSDELCLPMGLRQGCHSRLPAPRLGMQISLRDFSNIISVQWPRLSANLKNLQHSGNRIIAEIS
ncbi:hypothetical protein NKI79_25230 [Mesorhizobium sp. M0340]|uniref:hypothetical protein n=1 Tax=Mesorhizobium sp. M0340 TaxID=2956939 RepID=UPI003337D799